MRGIDALVERQVGRWELVEREPHRRRPCIALSRQPGAEGEELARRLAERLDYGLFDRQIVEAIAQETGVKARLVEGLDERVRSLIERFVTDGFAKQHFVESTYLRHVVHTIETLGTRGRAVILGRGAPYILPPSQALRVLVVAPRAVRVERLAKERSLPASEAAAELERREAERHAFTRHHFGVDQEEPSLYDLVVNTGTLSLEVATDVVIAALERQFAARPGR